MIEDKKKFKRRIALTVFFMFSGFMIGTEGGSRDDLLTEAHVEAPDTTREDSRGVEDAKVVEVVSEEVEAKKRPVGAVENAQSEIREIPKMSPETEVEYEKIEGFIEGYRGSRIDEQYLRLLYEGCDGDLYTLRLVVAIGVAESGLGRDVKADSNFWGWFKGGNRSYDPSREVMAKEICEGISKKYPNVHDGDKSAIYTGNDSTSSWLKNVNWALDQIDKLEKEKDEKRKIRYRV